MVFGISQEYFVDYMAIHERHDHNIILHKVNIDDLGELRHLGCAFHLNDSKITSLGKLETVEGDLRFHNTQLTDLGNLRQVGGSIFCDGGSDTHRLFMDSKFKEQVFTNMRPSDIVFHNRLITS